MRFWGVVMPTPGKNESQKDFVSRCIPIVLEDGTAKDQKQAAAICYSMWREAKEIDVDQEEKMMDGYVKPLGGATSFAELQEVQAAQEAAWKMDDLTWQYQDMIRNIMASDIEDKGAALRSLTDEFLGMVDDLAVTKSLWDHVKEVLTKAAPMKTVGGARYPSSDFLVVEDSQKPSTWHLQVKKHGKNDRRLMGAAKAALTSPGGHRGNKYAGPNKTEAIRKLKRMYAQEEMDWEKEITPASSTAAHPFMVLKDKSTGQYRWLAVYSNKYRDSDNPPEIIASTAHQDFVKAVDEGEWPMPELWLWHVPGTRAGAADLVAYDDTGFALATGTFDEGHEHTAKSLAAMDDLATSHGMPRKEIERDLEDPSIITRYRTREISPLPSWAAANKYLTGFQVLTKEDTMALPETKRPFLEDVMGEEGVADLERQLSEAAKELDEKVESKEETPAGEVVEEVVEEEAPPVKEEAPEPTPEPMPEPISITVEDVAQAVGAHLKPLMEQVATLAERVQGLEKELTNLQKSDEAKVKEALRLTPASSLHAMIGSVIGAEEAAVDGRTTLAKSGPTETHTEAGQPGHTFVPFINDLMAAQRGHGG